MRTFLTILLILSMLAVLAVLLTGVVGMARNQGNPHRANRLMQYRVVLQGVALLIFVLLMYALRG